MLSLLFNRVVRNLLKWVIIGWLVFSAIIDGYKYLFS